MCLTSTSLLYTPIVNYGLQTKVQKYCYGRVGIAKFCVKALVEGKTTCGTARHASKFPVDPDGAYILASDHHAFCSPILHLKNLNPNQRAKLVSTMRPLKEWESTCKSIDEGEFLDWLKEEKESEATGLTWQFLKDLVSPKNSEAKGGIFAIFPNFSFLVRCREKKMMEILGTSLSLWIEDSTKCA
jgi:hypothetical protein